MQAANKETALSSLAVEFVKAGVRKQRGDNLKYTSIWLILPLIGTFIIVHSLLIGTAKERVLAKNDCIRDPQIKGWLEYMWWTGYKKQLAGSHLCNQVLDGLYLPDADLDRADLRHSKLIDANLLKSNLSGTNFQDSLLIKAQLQGTNLKNSNLEDANLDGANLKKAYLENANLKTAKMMNANLQESYLANTNLEGAILEGADMTKADLQQSLNITEEQIRNVKICHTKLPNYIYTVKENRDCS
jgi:hypothetical protein